MVVVEVRAMKLALKASSALGTWRTHLAFEGWGGDQQDMGATYRLVRDKVLLWYPEQSPFLPKK